MKKYRIIIASLLVCMLLPTFVSCNKKSESSVYFLNFKPEVASVYNEISKTYKQETGVDLRVVTAASGTYEQTLKSEVGKKDAPTIFIINGPRGFSSWRDYCADLSKTELYKHLTDKSLCIAEGNAVYGIPAVVEGYGIIYNKALTDKYFSLGDRQKEINSIEEINNFDKLKTVVEDMTKLKNELGIKGVFASTSLQSGEDWRWQTHLANIPLYYEFESENVDLTDVSSTKEVSFKYSDNFKNIFDLYINNSTVDPKLLGSKQVADSMAEFALGECVMVQNGNWAWSQINDISGNVVKKEDIKFLPVYTGMEEESSQGLCIGTETFLCINSQVSEEKQKQAADFLYWLYSSDSGKEYVTEKLNFITPFDTFDSSELSSDPLSLQVNEWMKKENITTVPWNFTVFPSMNFKNDFGAALLQYAQGNMTWDSVKETFITRWKEEAGK